MDREKFLNWISGVDNPIGTIKGRFIIGGVFVLYGFGMSLMSQIETWTRVSIMLAFFGLGLMFLLDGQTILREHLK